MSTKQAALAMPQKPAAVLQIETESQRPEATEEKEAARAPIERSCGVLPVHVQS